MDILQLIDRLEELFNDAKAVPFTHNVVVDEDRMLEIIDQMRIVIPDEVKKAQQVLAQRDRFLAQAQEEADRTIVLAREKAEQIAAKDNIVVEAQRRAEQILAQARADAEATRRDADDYVVDTLVQLQDSLEKVLNQVRNGVRTVQEDQLRKTIPSSRLRRCRKKLISNQTAMPFRRRMTRACGSFLSMSSLCQHWDTQIYRFTTGSLSFCIKCSTRVPIRI